MITLGGSENRRNRRLQRTSEPPDPAWTGNSQFRFRIWGAAPGQEPELNVECLKTGCRWFSGGFARPQLEASNEPSLYRLVKASSKATLYIQYGENYGAEEFLKEMNRHNIHMVKSLYYG